MIRRALNFGLFFMLIVSPVHADVTDGLLGWWKLDEGSGILAADSSGQGNDGTLINSPAWVSGKRGLALSFDGTSQYVTVPDTSILELDFPFSIGVWINTTTAANRVILEKDQDSGYSMQTASGGSAGRIYLNIGGTGTGNRIISDTNGLLNDGRWHHVIFTVTTVSGAVYIDGVNDTRQTGHGPAVYGALTFDIAGRGATSNFPGFIDDVRIYNRELSETEIKAIYLSGNPQISVKGGGKIVGMKMN